VTILRLRHRTAAWLALASMVLNAAWPVLANAKPQVPTLEICSASGLNHAAGGAPGGSHGRNFHASHCSLCPFGAERGAAIPYVAPPRLPSAPAPVRVFTRRDAPPAEIATHPTARPRAPPFFS
jgi:hypothetical protein